MSTPSAHQRAQSRRRVCVSFLGWAVWLAASVAAGCWLDMFDKRLSN